MRFQDPPRHQVAVVWRNGVEAEVHHFKSPGVTMPGFYRETLSFDSYRSRECERFYRWTIGKRKKHLPIRAHVMRKAEFMQNLELFEETCEKLGGKLAGQRHHLRALPEFFHESVWGYYKAVGYDYKRQRYDLKTAS